MNLRGFSEFIAQAMVMLVAMEALSAVMAVLFGLTLAAFVIYPFGVWRLCRAEDRRHQRSVLITRRRRRRRRS